MKWASLIFSLCVLALTGFGLVMVYSVSPVDSSMKLMLRQVLGFGLGLVGASVMACLSLERLRKLAWVAGGLALVMLVLVLIPHVGHEANGARRWFKFGSFLFQPSDFAKLAAIFVVARYGAEYEHFIRTFRGGVLLPGLVGGFTLLLLFLEPDWGTSILMAVVATVMLLAAGARVRHYAIPVVVSLLVLGVMIKYNPVRGGRVHSWLHLEETKDGKGYQAWQARLALGVGGVTGVGFTQGTQRRFVPEHRTDFIYAVVGEEFGYVGTVTVIAVFLMLFFSGLRIAAGAADPFGRLVALGITFLFALQAFINIGVVSGALPNKGLPLPFISYGGTNLMMMLTCAGALLSVARHGVGQEELEAHPPMFTHLPVTQLS